MKKSILSLIALFAVATVSAQSYPKQPDPSVYEVVPYQKPVAAETEVKEQPAENTTETVPNNDRKTEVTTEEVKSTSSVAVNEDKNTNGKKRQQK
jgi:hypothetical protein